MNPENQPPPTQPAEPLPQIPADSAPPSQQPVESSSTLAIAGLVLFFVPVVGLVISILARKKAKTTLSLAGIIAGAIITGFFVAAVAVAMAGGFRTSLKGVSGDAESQVDIEYLGKSIEQYVEQKHMFPNALSNLTEMEDFDRLALEPPDGVSYYYEVTPEGCDKASTCTGYRVYTTDVHGDRIEASNTQPFESSD